MVATFAFFLLRLLPQPIVSLSPARSLSRVSLIARRFLCSVCLNLHHSSVCGISAGLLIKQLMTAFIPHLAALRPCICLSVSHNSLLVREWCLPVSAGLSAALVCLLFVAGDRQTDGALHFPLQSESATKCSIMQDGFYCRNDYHSRTLILCAF